MRFIIHRSGFLIFKSKYLNAVPISHCNYNLIKINTIFFTVIHMTMLTIANEPQISLCAINSQSCYDLIN